MTITLHPGAQADVASGFRYYRREAGRAVADRFLNEFERIARLIETNPSIGTPSGEERRSFPLVGFPYTVIYREVASGLRVLVVRHQRRDPGHGGERR